MVEHYSFYSVSQTPEEYRVMVGGRLLGKLPLNDLLAPDMTLSFSGRRWRVLAVHDRDRVIEVSPDASARPPIFGGDGGIIHDTVVQRMRTVLADDAPRRYLDHQAAELLAEARSWFGRLGLGEQNVIDLGDGSTLLATWAGTVRTNTLALALRGHGMSVEVHDGLLDVTGNAAGVRKTLERLAAAAPPTGEELALHVSAPAREKYHPYLSRELMLEDIIASRIEADAVPAMAERLLERTHTDNAV